MPPFQGDIDISFSSFDGGVFDKTESLPLHEEPLNVSFAPMVVIYDVPNTEDYTPEEIKASWYDVEDLKQMKSNARSHAKLLMAGLLPRDERRGLEAKTKEGLMKKRLHRNGAYNAVFIEIDYQIEEDIADDNAIANAYRPYSEPCAIAAQQAAEKDAMDAMVIFKNSNLI